MSFPQFITVNTTLSGMKVKNMIRIDRIHCISEVTDKGTTSVVIHYAAPDGSELETMVVQETMQELNRMLFHTTTGISDIGCGAPDTFPIDFEKLKQQGILRTTGIEESPQFT